jgi:hypothetical protein
MRMAYFHLFQDAEGEVRAVRDVGQFVSVMSVVSNGRYSPAMPRESYLAAVHRLGDFLGVVETNDLAHTACARADRAARDEPWMAETLQREDAGTASSCTWTRTHRGDVSAVV